MDYAEGDNTPLDNYIEARSKPGVSVGPIFGLAASICYQLDLHYIDPTGKVYLRLLELPLTLTSFTRHHTTSHYTRVYLGYVCNNNWTSENSQEWNHFIRLWQPEDEIVRADEEEEEKEDDISDSHEATVTNITASFPSGLLIKETSCDKCFNDNLLTKCTLQEGEWVCLQHFKQQQNTCSSPCSPKPFFPPCVTEQTRFCDFCPVDKPTTTCTLQNTHWVCPTHYKPSSDTAESMDLTPTRESTEISPLTPETNPASDQL